MEWDRAAPKNGNMDDKGKGGSAHSSNHPFVMHKQLKDQKCKSFLTTDMICRFGNNCKFDHTRFDDWNTNDEALQMEHIRENLDKVAFNRNGDIDGNTRP